jgi:hypothetical protein
MSMAMREGERVDPPAQPSKKTLQPGEKVTVQGDLVSWLGQLSPGEYGVSGSYTGAPKLGAPSNRVSLRVTQIQPVYASTAAQNLLVPQQTRDTVWINRTASGFDLFLLQASTKNPDVVYSNRRIASLAAAEQPVPSSYNIAAPKIQHVIWASDDGNLHVIRIPRGGVPGEPAVIALPDKDLKPVESPYTDDAGNLSLVVATADGKNAGLFLVPADGKTSFSPIQSASPVSMDRSFIRDFLAFCKEESGKSCRDLGIDSGKVAFAKIESRSHDSPAIEGYSPAPCPRNLGDQRMGVEAAEDPAHLGAGLFPILTTGTQMRRRFQFGPHIAIGKTSQAMLSVHDCLE